MHFCNSIDNDENVALLGLLAFGFSFLQTQPFKTISQQAKMPLQSLYFYHVVQSGIPAVTCRLYSWGLGNTGDIFLAKLTDNLHRPSGVCFFLM